MDKSKKINYYEFLKTAKEIGVAVKKILDLFWYLLKYGAIENNQLVQILGVAKNPLNQVKQSLSHYLNRVSRNTSLKKEMVNQLKSFFDQNYLTEESLLSVIEQTLIYKQSIEFFNSIKNKRIHPKREYDQFIATVATSAKKAAVLDFFADILQKRILFLGDDDFISLPVAKTGKAQQITVVDIDDAVLQKIKETADKQKLSLQTVKHDLRKPLPKELNNKFDVVFTDPPYTANGVALFVSRAIEALDKDNQTARIYLCFGNSDRAKERFLPIQEQLTKMGLMLRWIFDKFNRYDGAESIGNTSSLYITEITPKTRSLIRGQYEKPIYTID
jgi:predicted methyltransferase